MLLYSNVAKWSVRDKGCVTVRFDLVHPFSPRPSNQGLWSRGLSIIGQLQDSKVSMC